MVGRLAPKWTPRGIAQRSRGIVPSVRYVPLFLHIGWFLARTPALIARRDLTSFVRGLRGRSPRANQTLVVSMRAFWLRRFFPAHNTCYVRAMALYRFLDEPDERVRLHVGIEYREDSSQRLRGHAWVSVNGAIVEGPPVAYQGRIREIRLEAAV